MFTLGSDHDNFFSQNGMGNSQKGGWFDWFGVWGFGFGDWGYPKPGEPPPLLRVKVLGFWVPGSGF